LPPGKLAKKDRKGGQVKFSWNKSGKLKFWSEKI